MWLKWRHSSPIFHYAVNFIGRGRSGKFKAWSQGKKALELTFWFEYIFRCYKIPKPQKPCWPYRYFNTCIFILQENIHATRVGTSSAGKLDTTSKNSLRGITLRHNLWGLTISALHPHLSNLHPLLFRDILRNRYIESSITTLRTRLLKRKIGQRMINNLKRNSTQTAVTNMTIKRMLENKII